MTRVMKAALAVVLTAGALSLTACNTVAGAGQDVSSVGHDVTHGAAALQNAAPPQAARR